MKPAPQCSQRMARRSRVLGLRGRTGCRFGRARRGSGPLDSDPDEKLLTAKIAKNSRKGRQGNQSVQTLPSDLDSIFIYFVSHVMRGFQRRIWTGTCCSHGAGKGRFEVLRFGQVDGVGGCIGDIGGQDSYALVSS